MEVHRRPPADLMTNSCQQAPQLIRFGVPGVLSYYLLRSHLGYLAKKTDTTPMQEVMTLGQVREPLYLFIDVV